MALFKEVFRFLYITVAVCIGTVVANAATIIYLHDLLSNTVIRSLFPV